MYDGNKYNKCSIQQDYQQTEALKITLLLIVML